MMSSLRKILFPFSLLYELIIRLRNKLYDKELLKVHKFETPSICIGNINIGGSGKTPFISFMVDHFQNEKNLAILSRGYKRKTKGFKLVQPKNNASDVGDEPLQFKLQFPSVNVAVDENRANGMQELINAYQPDLILLDDAFQHRAVKADINIVLTMYQKPFYQDLTLPAGNLREPASAANRADIIIVTKTPESVSEKEKYRLKKKLQAYDDQPVFFSSIVYADTIIGREKEILLSDIDRFTLVTGIAQPQPLVDHLKRKGKNFEHLCFPDHHDFTTKELARIKKCQPILTTQKDFMRLKTYNELKEVYYLPIKFKILDQEKSFFQLLDDRLKIKAHPSSSSNRSSD